jgi:signal transduction histidine kinase
VPPRRTDLLVGVGAGAFGAGTLATWGSSGGGAIVAAAVLGGSLGLARRRPRVAWVVAVAALTVLAIAETNGPFAVWALVPAHAFCAGRWDGRWGGLAAVAGLTGAWELGALLGHQPGVPGLLIPAAAWGGARALADREVVAAQLADRVRDLEEERETHAQLSVRYERARIASELHDIVAHALSVMVVQATAGQRLAARDPGLTAETFEAIAGAARQAEADMGRLVALLGDDGAIGPAPDLQLVEELVARAAGGGLDVTLRLEGSREGLPAPLAQAAYRIVQEGLTNALRHASGAPVSVLVRGDPAALVVDVSNGPAAGDGALAGTGTGNGLRGLRELVDACGGTLDVGPVSGGGWRLTARLPRRVSAPTR